MLCHLSTDLSRLIESGGGNTTLRHNPDAGSATNLRGIFDAFTAENVITIYNQNGQTLLSSTGWLQNEHPININWTPTDGELTIVIGAKESGDAWDLVIKCVD